MGSAEVTRDHLVLLAEPDAAEGEKLGAWLEKAGYGVINCPGPPGAGLIWLGQRGKACGLVEIVDLLVLDVGLVADAAGERTPGRQLLHYYLSSGKPVLLLGDSAQTGRRYRSDQVAILPRRRGVTQRALLRSIRRLEATA